MILKALILAGIAQASTRPALKLGSPEYNDTWERLKNWYEQVEHEHRMQEPKFTLISPKLEHLSSDNVNAFTCLVSGVTYTVKFATDCRVRTDRVAREEVPKLLWNPLVNEFIILRSIEHLGLSPRALFLSRSDPLHRKPVTVNFQTRFFNRNFKSCHLAGVQGRYMIRDRVGPTLQSYIDVLLMDPIISNSRVFASTVLKLARKLVSMLRKLHKAGVILGDMRLSNVAFKRRIDDMQKVDVLEEEFVFLSFEHSYFFPSLVGTDAGKMLTSLDPIDQTIWQLEDARYGPRDDLYSVLWILAESLSRKQISSQWRLVVEAQLEAAGHPEPGSYEYEQILTGAAHFIKSGEPLFSLSDTRGFEAVIGEDVDELVQMNIRTRLTGLMSQFIMDHPSPDNKPDHNRVAEELESLIAILN